MEVDWPWETPCFNLLTLLTYLVNRYTKQIVMCAQEEKNEVERKMAIKAFWCMHTKKTSVREG